jgi:hypothetical protein
MSKYLNNDEATRIELKEKLSILTSKIVPSKNITYGEIAKLLNIAEEDVEILLIEGCREKLLSGKCNQANKSFYCLNSCKSNFDENDWKALGDEVEELITEIDVVINKYFE